MFLLSTIIVFGQEQNTKKPTNHNSTDILEIVQPDTATIMDIHPQDSPEDRGILVESKDGKTTLRMRGSIRLSGAYDLNGLQSKATF